MKELNDYISELKNFESNLPKYIEKIVIDNKGLLLKKLKLRLFNYGIDGAGNLITPQYTEKTVLIKKKNNQRSSHVTLRDTGSFYAGMFVEYYNNKVNIFSTDYKEDFLTEKYGDDILELTLEEQRFFIFTVLEPEIQKIINSFGSGKINL